MGVNPPEAEAMDDQSRHRPAGQHRGGLGRAAATRGRDRPSAWSGSWPRPVATADGLAAVSMSRVAADLGVSTMSLYRYVAAKDACWP